MKKTILLTLSLLVTTTAFANCREVKAKLIPKDTLFRYVDGLADLHVYYGAIDRIKVGSIQKVYITKSCSQNTRKAHLIRFQTEAQSPYEQKKLFFCFSKVMSYGNGKLYNNGTFCSETPSKNASIDFPYNSSVDPYSLTKVKNGSVDEVEDEFSQGGRRGFEENMDPFYNSYTRNDGPDSRNDGDF